MKKALSSVLAILLALAMFGMLTACNGNEEDPTEPETTEAIVETDPITEPVDVTVEVTDPAEDTTTVPAATEEVTTVQAAADPSAMSKDELVKYFNEIIDSTRAAKPSYKRVSVKKMTSVKTSLLGGAADGIVNNIVKDKMPGTPETYNQSKGSDNADQIFGPNSKGKVRASDVSSISAAKSGDGYVLTVKLGNEINPSKDGDGKYSRMLSIATRQDVLDELADSGVQGDVNKAELKYHDGKLVITVDAEGKITKLSEEFYVDADAKDVKVSILKADIIAYQETTSEYSNFKY